MNTTELNRSHLSKHTALLELPMRMTLSPRGVALAIFLSFSLWSPLASASEDPLENVNRATHSFNRVVDKIVLKPLARSYDVIVPRFMKLGIRNAFSNLDDVKVVVNDVLQLDFNAAASDLARVAVNSTIGVGGLLDVADPALGLTKNRQDFGLTLAHYGVESGPYVVLPILGPSTVRDAFGLGFDSAIKPVRQVDHVPTRNTALAAEAIDFRAGLLSFDDFIIGDDYLFIREAYLQQREYAVGEDTMTVAFEEF